MNTWKTKKQIWNPIVNYRNNVGLRNMRKYLMPITQVVGKNIWSKYITNFYIDYIYCVEISLFKMNTLIDVN